jgi:hypothetical protein
VSISRATAEPRQVTYRSLAAAARRIPSCRNESSVHPASVTRWITKGIRLQDGTTLKLKAVRFPGGWGVSDEAVDAVGDALTRDRCGEPARSSDDRVNQARQNQLDRVDDQLAAIGV